MKKTNLVVVENQANKCSLAVVEISSGFLSQWIAWIEPGIKILNMTVGHRMSYRKDRFKISFLNMLLLRVILEIICLL